MWWHLGLDIMVTSTWGTPNMVKDGVNPELLLAGKYGNRLHMWDLRRRRHVQELELGAEQQMTLELRPAHDPTRAYGFVGVVVSLKDLSSSIWLWHREASGNESGGRTNGKWAIRKVIEIPAEPADPKVLPPILQGFKAVAPLVSDINLSIDDRYLYVSCWGTGEFIQYDVLMASAHGAGFMVLPFVLGVPAVAASEHAEHMVVRDTGGPWANAMAVGIHTLVYLLVTTLVACVVYRKLGLRLLRTAWINLDWLWAGALAITGAVVLLT